MTVQNKRVLVTGGGRGIGRGIVEGFVEAGARVAIADIAGAEQAAKDIGGDTVGVTCDVSSGESVASALTAVGESLGGLDVVVNNAGVEAFGPLHELSEDSFDKVISVNLRGTWLVYKHAVPLMQGGAIVNIASLAGIVGFPLLGAYAAAKAGVVRLTEVMAVELRDLGVRANAICPGFIDTPMMRRAFDDFEAPPGGPSLEEIITARQGRLGKPQEVASLAVFLASDAATFVNGTAITLDGGMNVNRL
ncbi:MULTISPECIES: SDR family NAD(P)-dependent oxidoreductase [unclassified Rhodococcus (in: high G+C Gram-positive bacteria)]|uniref:SDR family NAD(P)-dependent oxidoreductase n=1 Tax=unclassified Rhodococcus (in: high G+C Gram-positive bacteria) TaxID=192944 RepID=UPI000271F946|nr:MULTISPECIES: SDR family NAD(P)-dependent oxidoreductase [unclassified Rhodococcus (in: high G+C Gram-positive bacteria)]EJI97767.1 2,5-dichloro-2,5-cyclohexadiene-1,4-diol dehydrogenase [Rhodococcus sp. JVH1]